MDNVNQSARALEDELMELVHRVMHQYRSEQYLALRDSASTDVTHMESKVLGYLASHPQATQSDLARHSRRDKAQLARLVKALRERGLVAGEADAADRRNVRLALTAEGAAVLKSLQQHTRRLARKAASGLSAQERAQIVALLRRVSANLAPHT